MVDGTTKAVADATKAVAETTGKVIDFADGVATYSTRLVGEALAEGGGILSDQVKHWRKMRMLTLEAKFNDACAARNFNPDAMRPLTLGQTVRVLEAASLEESDEVQDLWAELLANSVDPAGGVTMKKIYVSLLKEIGPLEAALLNLMVEYRAFHLQFTVESNFEVVGKALNDLAERNWRKFPEADRLGAIANLRRIGCVAPDLRRAPTDRLLVQNAVQPADRGGMLVRRETRVTGVDPNEFRRFTKWIVDTVMSASGATPTQLSEGGPLLDKRGQPLAYFSVPEMSLALTPLGDDLMNACSRQPMTQSIGEERA